MKLNEFGKIAALRELGVKIANGMPDPYQASGALGAVGGGALGALAGGPLGELAARHIGEISRTPIFGMGIPGTGYGESLFTTPKGPLYGQMAGSLLGGAAGAGAGYHAGHMQAMKGRQHPYMLPPINAYEGA